MTDVGFETANVNSRAGAMTSSNARRRTQQRFAKHMRWKVRMERLLDKLDFPEELERQQRTEPIRHVYRQAELFVPAHDGLSLPPSLLSTSQRYEQIHWTLERSLGMLRRILAGLTSPPPLRALQLEARIAWERFDEGDPEPLDTFIKNRLGIMSNFAGSLPREVRSRVMKFLDGCFATVPLYQPGDWLLLGPPQLDQLTELVGENIKGFPDLKIALSGNGRTFRETLLEELPGVTR